MKYILLIKDNSRILGIACWITDKSQSLMTKIQKLYSSFQLLKDTSKRAESISAVSHFDINNTVFEVPQSNFFTPLYGKKWTNPDRAAVYRDSIQAMEHGYKLNGKLITLDCEKMNAMISGAQFYETKKRARAY